MSINSTLKKEGIKVIGQLNTLEINKIASSISEKISKAFEKYEHKVVIKANDSSRRKRCIFL